MPIVRTYGCPVCNHLIEAVLSAENWDQAPPPCPSCDAREMQQEFQPPRINGSAGARASAITENILSNDYAVANIPTSPSRGGPVTYKDDMMGVPKVQGRTWSNATPSFWGANGAALGEAAASGRAIRQQFGNGLDVLQSCLKDGSQRDLIADSRMRSARVW